MAPVCLLNILASVCILIFLIYINAIVLAAPQAATITSLSPSTARASANGGWANIEYLFAFGDSYSTTGFDIDGAQPNRSNPIGNPAYPGSTQVGTASFVDYLATRYNQSFIELFNFATGGASIDDTIDPSPYGPAVHSFNHQVQDEFLLKYANGSHTPWTGENSLVAVEFGINDGVMINGRSNGTAIAAQLMKSYEDSLSKIYDAFARRFIILNVPAVDRGPAGPAVPTEFLKTFNGMLADTVNTFRTSHPDATVYMLDTYSLFNQVLDDPSSFHITSVLRNTTDACEAYQSSTNETLYDPSCGVPRNEYFWADYLHPTSTVDDLIASQMSGLLTA